jgi:hypothetical protein
MKTKKHFILVLLGLACVGILPLRLSGIIGSEILQDDIFASCALDGLKGVSVKVVHLLSTFEEGRLPRNPIDVNDLRAQAELVLRKAGVRVFEKSPHDPEVAELVITVNNWKGRFTHSYIVQVKTEVYQLAELVRGRRLQIMAPTWPGGVRIQEAEKTAIIDLFLIRRAVQSEVERQVRIFIDDFLKANVPVMTGTVRHLDLEGGFYGIFADNGERYDAHNLPREFAVDGLRVKFRAVEEKGAVCIHMWGKTVKIIWIEKL